MHTSSAPLLINMVAIGALFTHKPEARPQVREFELQLLALRLNFINLTQSEALWRLVHKLVASSVGPAVLTVPAKS